jgi:succinoglycan biosynthesis transport protein ExoP
MNDQVLALPEDRGKLPAVPGGRQLAFSSEELEEPSGSHIGAWLRILYRWRWLVLTIWAMTTAGFVMNSVLQTPLYRASATLELNPAPAKVVQDKGSADEPRQDDRDFLALQIGLVKSRALAERVARQLNLGRDPAFLGHAPGPNAKADDAVGALMSGFSAVGTTSDRILQISFVHPNPALAARVVNTFADEAIQNTYERSDEASAHSRAYLQKRLEVTRQELENSERSLIAYERAAHIVNIQAGQNGPSSGDTAGGTLLAGNLIALNAALADAQNARIVAQQRYAQANASVSSAQAADATGQLLIQQKAQLQAEYEQKRSRFKPDFPDMVALQSRINALDTQIAQAAGRTQSAVSGSLRADFVAAQSRENQLRQKINQLQSQLLNLNDRGVQYTILHRAVDANRSLYNSLLERLGQESSSATRTNSVSLVDTARPPSLPFSPSLLRALFLGLLFGGVLGAAGARGAESWYDTIDLPDDLRDLFGLPVLGVVPKTHGKENVDEMLADPRSPISEAYHSIRAALQYLTPHGTPRSILFTSARAAEGKTSTTIAIAANFVGLGRRIVVIDGDMRKPSLRGNPGTGGLSDVLSGSHSLTDVVVETETPGMYLIHAGVTPPDPTVLLDSSGLSDMVRSLERQFDVVIIDGPPVLGLADAPLLARVAEATVLVVESGRTRRGAARDAMRRLFLLRANVVGTVLTKFDRKSQGYGYGYGGYSYDYAYGGDTPKRALIGPKAPNPEAAADE